MMTTLATVQEDMVKTLQIACQATFSTFTDTIPSTCPVPEEHDVKTEYQPFMKLEAEPEEPEFIPDSSMHDIWEQIAAGDAATSSRPLDAELPQLFQTTEHQPSTDVYAFPAESIPPSGV